jgi:hypothetical protein
MAVSPTICPDFVWHCLNFPLSDFSRTLLCKGNSGRKVINLYLPWKPLIRGDLKERPIERCCIFEGGEREAGRGLSLVHTSSPIGDFSSPGLFLTVPLSDACLHWSYIEDCPTPCYIEDCPTPPSLPDKPEFILAFWYWASRFSNKFKILLFFYLPLFFYFKKHLTRISCFKKIFLKIVKSYFLLRTD